MMKQMFKISTLYQVKVLITQLCLTLCNPLDCNLPGSSFHGILQARILKWVAIPFPRGSAWPIWYTSFYLWEMSLITWLSQNSRTTLMDTKGYLGRGKIVHLYDHVFKSIKSNLFKLFSHGWALGMRPLSVSLFWIKILEQETGMEILMNDIMANVLH